jgi:hypothetical protein
MEVLGRKVCTGGRAALISASNDAPASLKPDHRLNLAL